MADITDDLWNGGRPAERMRKGFRDVMSEARDCPLVANDVFLSGLNYVCVDIPIVTSFEALS